MASGRCHRLSLPLRHCLTRRSASVAVTSCHQFLTPKISASGGLGNNEHFASRCLLHTSSTYSTKLAEVGKIEPIKDENYDTGQCFLHRVFGYRGVILFPWTAEVLNRDQQQQLKNGEKFSTTTKAKPIRGSSNSGPIKQKDSKGEYHTFYQVLIDARDWRHIAHRAQTEAVTFLGSQPQNNRNLYAIPGLDYVAHEDIIPYSTRDKAPIQHDLFDKFLAPSPGLKEGEDDVIFEPQKPLLNWKEKNHPWLALSSVHKDTTENIRVTVIPFYMGYREDRGNNVYWVRT